MRHILLFGAGKSANFLIKYLKELSESCRYTVTVADECLENARSKVGEHRFVKAAIANAENATERGNLIKQADIVYSCFNRTRKTWDCL